MIRKVNVPVRLAALVICFMAAVSASAGDLNVSRFFKEDFASDPNVTMVSMSGRKAKWNGLTSYKSVSVSGDSEKADEVARAVRKDGTGAEYKETSYKDGKLYFGFYSLGGEGRNRKYLFYLDLRPKGKDKTTFVYIEGDWTAEEVKKMITKKIN